MQIETKISNWIMAMLSSPCMIGNVLMVGEIHHGPGFRTKELVLLWMITRIDDTR